MSTSPSATSTGGGASTSSPSSSPSAHPSSDTATLYLFTFLATILILVLLSASLVLRSYILRRRYRQRFQQALADGLFTDLDRDGQFDALGRFHRRLGPKPVVLDTWIHPADKHDVWSSITPVAVQCSLLLSPPSTSSSSPRPSIAPSPTARPPFFRIPSPFSLSPPSTPPPPDHTEKDAAMLAVCVLVAMPDASAPVYRSAPDAKGKGVDPHWSQAHPQNGDADSLLPSSPQGARTSNKEGLPVLEFGVVEMTAGEWVWST